MDNSSLFFLTFNVHFFKVVKTANISQKQVLTFYNVIEPVPPSPSTSNRKPQIEHLVFESTIGFSFKNFCFLMSSTSKKFGFLIPENQSFKVSMVNFSSRENSSAREVDFS